MGLFQLAPRSSNSTLLYYQRSQEQVKGLEMIPDLMAQLPFHKNELLFGHDSTPSLIAFEIEGLDRVRIFRRQGDLTLKQDFQLISGTLRSGSNTMPITNGRLRGDQISFSAGGAQYTGRVNGNAIEGTVKSGGSNSKWNATRAGK